MKGIKILSLQSVHKLKKLSYIIITALVFISTGLLLWYLNKNFYRTITRAEEVIILQQEVAPHSINGNLLTIVLDQLGQRQVSYQVEIEEISNPFSNTDAVPATALEEINSSTSTSTTSTIEAFSQ